MRVSTLICLSVLVQATLPAKACEDYVEASAGEAVVAQASSVPAVTAQPGAVDLSAAAAKKTAKRMAKKKEKVEYMRIAP